MEHGQGAHRWQWRQECDANRQGREHPLLHQLYFLVEMSHSSAQSGRTCLQIWELMNEIWYDERNLVSFCKVLGKFSYKKFKVNGLSPQWYWISYQGHILRNLPHKLLALCWVLSSLVDPCWEICHAPKIKITYTPHICAASTLEVQHLPQNILLLN